VRKNRHRRRYESMQLTFSTQALREICEKEKTADRELGVGSASQLRRRIADILAADSLEDLIGLEFVGTADGPNFEIPLGGGASLEFSAPQPSKNRIGTPKPSKVQHIKVTGIRK
jgi:hypothetical protein